MQVSEVVNTANLLEQFRDIRGMTEKICDRLQKEDHVVQPVIDVSPPKWHLAHTSWFFENFLLKPYLKDYKEFHPQYNFLFNSYYESVGKRVLRDKRGNLTRPGVDEVLQYRQHVNENMESLLQQGFDNNEDEEKFLKFLEIGMQHEQQHQELLVTDIKYILGTNPVFPAYFSPLSSENGKHNTPQITPQFLQVPAGIYEIGYKGNGYCWDNEKPVHKVLLDDFAIRNTLVTNREYMEFIKDGGYEDFRFWLADGWTLAQQEEWEAPFYWHKIDGSWKYYTMRGLEDINPDEPVTHISFYEADAYSTWAGKRLLTEQEWEAAAQHFVSEKQSKSNFLENENFHPVAASATATANETGQDMCYDLLGNTWEWTYSSYHPYPGYKREEGALGEYNGKFMINQIVLRGGSCATPKNHIRHTYRNFFQADKRWQFSGIRLGEISRKS